MPPKASLVLAFLLLFSGCLARQQQQQQNQCQFRRINPLEPTETVQAEAGVTEFWNPNEQQFQCAGAEFVRHRIQPNGLLLPSYVNTPILAYVEQGRGVQGVVLPGCPETFESSQQQSQQERSRGPRFMDRHQKIQNLRQGDVAAIPAGAAHWIHNNGDRELVLVVFFDTQNDANQLDQNHRRFFLAGNPQAGRRQGQQGQGQGQQQQQQQFNAGNIFSGFDTEFIAEAFNVDRQTAERLGGQQDQRGHIVNVPQGLEMVRPQYSAERRQEGQQGGQEGQQGGRGSDNGFDETICATELRMNIDKMSRVDFANPQAGRLTNLNNYKFPILRLLQLSVQRGELHRDAMVAPHWTLNAHNVLYVTGGSMRMQIVNNEGQSVFDDEIRERQVVVIPQNFAVIKRAGQQGCRWVSFRTNDNAMVSTLAGRTSAIRAMPVDVVANAFQIPREQAQSLKFNQEETFLFRPRSSRRERWAVA